eukprot:SAG11_NODE_2886_length_2867_cov_1.874277_6_plen_75_part_00
MISYHVFSAGASFESLRSRRSLVAAHCADAAELRNRNSFIVPFDEVEDSGRENLAGMLALGEHVLANPPTQIKK